ncbi:hypothetical protein LCGC14_0408750 [marine sediment metagenome]|uniref:PARP-type domain-containing protein n=1 Tax=marine sediment metagenome TaxID=412755 RepID=A0A0F9W3J3_9ZZZZ
MVKMKASICPECRKSIQRHDANRINVKVADGSNGKGVYKEYHLNCYQSK